ncbi:S8 family serine peptidase [Pontiella sp.]|uniref:S8 family serine peptidase n=1 Tax=Pontiella sp. TaxID=2837462 RepID=UPI003567A4DA
MMKRTVFALCVMVSAVFAEEAATNATADARFGGREDQTNGYTRAMSIRDANIISEARGKRAQILSKRRDMKDRQKRSEVVRQLRELEEERMSAVKRRAKAEGVAVQGRYSDGRGFQLIDFDDKGFPVYEEDFNVNAAITTAADEVRSNATYNAVDGSSVTIGLWEAGGTPRTTHQELSGRVTVMDGSTSTSDHSTHVSGTLISRGIDARTLGMAPGASIVAFNSSYAETEMTAYGAAEPGTTNVYISNHSYGVTRGWKWDDDVWVFRGTFVDDDDPSTDYEDDFGRYNYRSEDWDALTYNLPYYLPFAAAGNGRQNVPGAGDTWTYGSSYTNTYDSTKHPAGNAVYKGGWDNMEGGTLAKNVIAVGWADDGLDDNGNRDPVEAKALKYSSRGPADDGRIKPDIYGNGQGLRSSTASSDTSTSSYSGTSMATPNVCGSAALLIDYYTSRFPGEAMRASTLKALILHTADDRGADGPGYKYGWGIMNTQAAADVIKAHADNQGGGTLLESRLSTTTPSRTRTFGWDGTSPLRVTLCWTDPASPQIYGHDNRTKALVNDLNLKVIGPDGTHYPYVMPYVADGDWDESKIDDAATTGVNDVDNVEQVYLASPVAGTYTIVVDYAGTLTNGEQIYSLVVTGQTAAEIEVDDMGPPVVALVDYSGTEDYSDFGAAAPSGAPVVRTYTIRNTGGSPLTDLSITNTLGNEYDFTAGPLATNQLDTGESTTFAVSYDPLGTGMRATLLQIANNDADENPFDIVLIATGMTELEAWRSDYFGTTNAAGDAADEADFDEDGYANLLEFGLATSPTVSNADPVVFAVDSSDATLTYPRNLNSTNEYDFEMIWSDNLLSNNWSTVGVIENILSSDGSVEQVESSMSTGSATNRYFRLRIKKK